MRPADGPCPDVAAHRYLDLPRDTRVVSHNLDGRQFVQELATKGAYTLVVQDAVNDLSVPYHIMTREYNDQVRALLQPDGAYLLTVIDLYSDGDQVLVGEVTNCSENAGGYFVPRSAEVKASKLMFGTA